MAQSHQSRSGTGPARRFLQAELLRSATSTAMDFLNGIAEKYPQAISFAAGRPPGAFLGANQTPAFLQAGIQAAAQRGPSGALLSLEQAWIRFGQYADTDGIIVDDLRQLLIRMEGLEDDDLDLQITNGIQEALLIECLAAAALGGAVLSFDPTYAGLTGAAATAGLPLYAMPRGPDPAGIIAATIRQARLETAGPLLLYLIPDHDNPTGISLTLPERQEIVALAASHGVTILEDTAYRLFNYDQDRPASLFALAGPASPVVYLFSFSKAFMPGIRIGFSARRKTATRTAAHRAALTNIKSYISVTTSPIAQAVITGFLQDCAYDLDQANRAKVQHCRANRDALAAGLRAALPPGLAAFNTPGGGFFMTLETGLPCDQAFMERAARDYGVLFTPMAFFSPIGQGANQIRLSFSAGSLADMTTGAARLADFLASEKI